MPPEEIRTIDQEQAEEQPAFHPRERRGRNQEGSRRIPDEGLPHTSDVRSVKALEMLRLSRQFEERKAKIRGATPAETYGKAIILTNKAERTASAFDRLAILEGIHDTLIEEREKVLEEHKHKITAEEFRLGIFEDLHQGIELEGQIYEGIAVTEYAPGIRRSLDDAFRRVSEWFGVPPDKRKRTILETAKRFVDLGVRFPITCWARGHLFGEQLKMEDWGVYQNNKYYPPTPTESDFYDHHKYQLHYREVGFDLLCRQIEAQSLTPIEGSKVGSLTAMQETYNFLEQLVPYWQEKLSLIDGRREKEELGSTRRWLEDIGKLHRQARGLYGKLTRANLATELPEESYDHLNNYLTERGHLLIDQYFTYYEEGRAATPQAQAHFEKTRRLMDIQNELESLSDSNSDEGTRQRVRQHLLDFMQDDYAEFVGEGSFERPQGRIVGLQKSIREKQSTYGDVVAEVSAMIDYIEEQLSRLTLPTDDLETHGEHYFRSQRFRQQYIEPYLEVLRTLNKIDNERAVLDRLDNLTGFGEEIKGRDLAVLIERVEDGMLPLEGQVDKLLPGGMREAGRAAEIMVELAEERRLLAVEVERQQITEALGLEATVNDAEVLAAIQRLSFTTALEGETLPKLFSAFEGIARILTLPPGEAIEAGALAKVRALLEVVPSDTMSDDAKRRFLDTLEESLPEARPGQGARITAARTAKFEAWINVFSIIMELLGFRV